MSHSIKITRVKLVAGVVFLVGATLVAVASWFGCCGVQASGLELLVTKEGHLQQPALELLRLCAPLYEHDVVLPADRLAGILDAKTPASDITLEEVNKLAQRYFKRPEGIERRDIKHDQFDVLDHEGIRALCKELGLVDAVMPELKRHVDYVLLQGATVKVMRTRIEALVHLVKEEKLTVSPDTHIIFLTGQRDLFDDEKQEIASVSRDLKNSFQQAAFQNEALITTELDAAMWLWVQVTLPTALRYSPVQFVNAAKRKRVDQHGVEHLSRPTTFDTVARWLTDKPAPGYCVSISSQPYVTYQTVTALDALHKAGAEGFAVYGVGYETKADVRVGVLLDTFARIIYTVVHNKALLTDIT